MNIHIYRVVDNSGERSSGRDSDSVINGVSPGRDEQNSAALRLVETMESHGCLSELLRNKMHYR